MAKDLRWRILLIVVILGACLYAIIPPEKIRLGLDLKGGAHMVLRVNTDDALRLETDTTGDRLRESLEKAGVSGATVRTVSPTRFEVSGVQPAQEAAVRQAATEVEAVFNRESGSSGTFVFSMKPNVAQQLRTEAVNQAFQTIDRRINALGVTEPTIARQGTNNDELMVQLPGVTDVPHAKEIIGKTAMLELDLVESGPMPTKEALLQNTGGQVPANMKIVSGTSSREGETPSAEYYLVRRTPVVTGSDLRNAKPTLDENNLPAVSFSLKPEGARKFGKVTGENVGRALAIVLDNSVMSAPRIDSRITDSGQISGHFTQKEAADLSLVLRSGALPASLTYLQEQTVGATLGADSVKAGLTASLASLALVMLFMLFYYRLSGINSVVALIFNLVILLGAMSYFGATMTLPGIAAFVLTMGVGVDSNVLIFERIKEELAAGKGVKASLDTGFNRVFVTLLDTHISALISAAFLFQFGTGPIRGFATTLFIGLISNLFTATFVSRTLFLMVLSRRQVATLSI
ncbi:MAG: protein translocase subunit SecD [Bacteroidales bacterium]